jgi:nitroimidazol reductase NimA-like FMN-containing flavoprotein (pyridoxamine 5'-phosphate oxidase superfamily)
MKNVNDTVRRKDRIMDEASAMKLIKDAEYGVLSMWDAVAQQPYAVPVSYVWDGKDSVYFHCAIEGRKLRCIEKDPNVTLCIVGKTRVIQEKFTTKRESVILSGTAHAHLGNEEKMKSLELLIDKFSPDFKEKGLKYAEKSLQRVEMIRIDIISWSGKCSK